MSEAQTTQKPLPCPFCGGEKVAISEGLTYRWAHAECAECGAAAGEIRRQYGQGTDNPEVAGAAIAEWNTRDRREIDRLAAQLDEARAEVERLRPAAEAWREMEHMFHSGPSSLELSYSLARSMNTSSEAAAARAREARS